METKTKHFTDELLKDNPYGYPWEQVVDAYLKSGYREEDRQYELTVLGSTYKVLKREEVTVFYDANGNTLFDVVNERLKQEYEWLMNEGTKAGTETTNSDEGNKDVISTGLGKELSVPATVEVADSEKEDSRPVKLAAKEKLEKELKEADNKSFAEPIIGYLLKRCEEDEGVAEDVMQEHKTWNKCFDYIYEQARKQATKNRAAVRDDVVYEWAEDYYHKDDKAEEEKKAKEAAERKKKQEERAKKEKSAPKKAEEPKPRKNGKAMEGQLDMFSMLEM